MATKTFTVEEDVRSSLSESKETKAFSVEEDFRSSLSDELLKVYLKHGKETSYASRCWISTPSCPSFAVVSLTQNSNARIITDLYMRLVQWEVYSSGPSVKLPDRPITYGYESYGYEDSYKTIEEALDGITQKAKSYNNNVTGWKERGLDVPQLNFWGQLADKRVLEQHLRANFPQAWGTETKDSGAATEVSKSIRGVRTGSSFPATSGSKRPGTLPETVFKRQRIQ